MNLVQKYTKTDDESVSRTSAQQQVELKPAILIKYDYFTLRCPCTCGMLPPTDVFERFPKTFQLTWFVLYEEEINLLFWF